MEQTEPIGENVPEPDSSSDNRRQDAADAEVHHPAEGMHNAVNDPPEASGHHAEEERPAEVESRPATLEEMESAHHPPHPEVNPPTDNPVNLSKMSEATEHEIHEAATSQAAHHVRTITLMTEYRSQEENERHMSQQMGEAAQGHVIHFSESAAQMDGGEDRRTIRQVAHQHEVAEYYTHSGHSYAEMDPTTGRYDLKEGKGEPIGVPVQLEQPDGTTTEAYLMMSDDPEGHATHPFIGGRLATFQMALAREVNLDPATSGHRSADTPEQTSQVYSTLTPRPCVMRTDLYGRGEIQESYETGQPFS